MRKFEDFFNKIATVRSSMRGHVSTLFVKEVIGASTKNNRTVTVNQTITFLNAIGKKKLAKQLEAVYEVLKPEIIALRWDRTNRTDAIDIGEFVDTYRHLVMNNKLYRRNISITLRKV